MTPRFARIHNQRAINLDTVTITDQLLAFGGMTPDADGHGIELLLGKSLRQSRCIDRCLHSRTLWHVQGHEHLVLRQRKYDLDLHEP